MASKSEAEVQLKSSPDKLWEAVSNTTELFPKLFPEHYKSIEILEGNGMSVGSIHLVNYKQDPSGLLGETYAKERIEEVDAEKKLVSYRVIEGDIQKLYKSFKATVRAEPKGEGEGSLVKWTLEYEKASDEVPEPDLITKAAVMTFYGLDAYLQSNCN